MNREPIVFYVKCRPQDSDAWPVAEKYNIVFVGYPPWNPNATASISPDGCRGYSGVLFNIAQEPYCASQVDENSSYRRAVTANANLVACVTDQSYVIVPRPQNGLCHIGKVNGGFQLVDEPQWADYYMGLRKKQNLDRSEVSSHVGDVVQVWHIEGWKSVTFPLVPRWIGYRLLSRNTSGIIYDIPDAGLYAYQRVKSLLCAPQTPSSGISDLVEIEKQLLEWISPTVFEQLVVQLLQLEAGEKRRWHHVGGSGDGGADGLALSPEGNITGVLQCKWHFGGTVQGLINNLEPIRLQWPNCQVILAVLIGQSPDPSTIPPWARFLGRKEIASMVEHYWDRLPIAQTLGIRGKS